jgi:crotonobetainyl-CoA:carnitine CoA-transferase CaiB-like acyl-CoA transferase
MSITGPEDDEGHGPQKVGVAIADIMAGMYAVSAILAALVSRERSGRGQRIEVPLYDSQVAWLANQAMNYLVGGAVPGRLGTAHPNLVPYQAFATRDGDLMLAVGNDRQFRACMQCVGLAELGDDVRFADNDARVRNRAELIGILGERLGKESTDYWLERFARHDVPAGPINDIGQVLSGDFARERRLVRSVTNASGDAVPLVRNPVDFEHTPVGYDRAPPLLGEHTGEVLKEWLGYSPQQIDALRRELAI